jgi:hypothetical protein
MVTLTTIRLISRVGTTMTPPALLLGLGALNATDGQSEFIEIEAGMALRTLCRRLTMNANFELRKAGRLGDFLGHSELGRSSSSIVSERTFKSKKVW